MKIYLIGYMGSGKTTLGKELALLTGYQFYDLDEMISEKYKISVQDIFEKYDENAFRLLEQATLEETATLTNAIISTGGGTPCFFHNMDFINDNGLSVYLEMSSTALVKRLIDAKRKRPLIEGKSKDELFSFVTSQLEWREPFYRRAKLIINGETPDTQTIVNFLIKSKQND